jgi:hypothetical protein
MQTRFPSLAPLSWMPLVCALGVTGCKNSASNTDGGAPTGDMTSLFADDGPRSTDLAGTSSDTVTLQLTPFTVPAGTEVYKCQNFKNPFGGAAVEVKEFESHMTSGSHHLLLFYKASATDDPIEDCSGLEFAASPYGSQRPDDGIRYPDGVAALVPGANGFRLQAHYLNTTQQPIDASVKVVFHLALPGTITDHASVLFFNNTDIYIPSGSTPVPQTKTCTVSQDINLIMATSHMHQHGISFTATSGGTTIFQTTQWSDPTPAMFAPPLVLKAGSQVTFTCTYMNDTGAPLYFGESALTNEMCILSGQFYPSTQGLSCF